MKLILAAYSLLDGFDHWRAKKEVFQLVRSQKKGEWKERKEKK